MKRQVKAIRPELQEVLDGATRLDALARSAEKPGSWVALLLQVYMPEVRVK